MLNSTRAFLVQVLWIGLRAGEFQWAVAFVLAMISVTASPVQAEQCPREGLSKFCCGRAAPLNAMDRNEGGYSWSPGPSDSAGLCQGLASRNVSGALIELQDLRETESLTTLPDRLAVGYRVLPWSVDVRPVLIGTPLTSGNNYFIAGSFETGNTVVWDTRPFSQAGQELSGFGFVAATKYKGRIVYTPLVFGKAGAPFAKRADAQLVLRSTLAIDSAAITMEPLDPRTLEPTRGERRSLPHTQPRARMLLAKLPGDMPEAFLVSVAICTAGTASCRVTDDSPPTEQFRIVWPKP